MSSENPSSGKMPAAGEEKVQEPTEVEEPVTEPVGETAPEDEYEELIEPEKPKKPRKKRKHLGAIITVIAIIVILVVWTLLSPRIMPSEGMTYVNSSTYANLGSFNDTLKSWAAITTWGVSAGTPSGIVSAENVTIAAGQTITILVLVSKVSEKPGNFWFRGTAASMTNLTVIDKKTGVIVASMTNKSHLAYGELGTLKLSLPAGHYDLKVMGQFLVYVDMRIGFLPVEKVSFGGEVPFDLKELVIS